MRNDFRITSPKLRRKYLAVAVCVMLLWTIYLAQYRFHHQFGPSDIVSYVMSKVRDSSYPGIDNYIQYTTSRLKITHLPCIEPLRPEFGPVINNVTSFHYVIDSQQCQVKSDRKSVFIAVISAPGYFSKRSSIRNTWKSYLTEMYMASSIEVAGFVFVVGNSKSETTQRKIREENDEHGDILQIDMVDSYYNLTTKLAGLMNWLHKNCNHVDFILKVDDDVYINVRNLASVLVSNDPTTEQIFGLYIPFHPLRIGKWAIGYDEWPWNDYPPYFSGPCVLMTGKAVAPLLAAFQVVPLFPFEDLYLSGLCTEKAKIASMHSPHILFREDNRGPGEVQETVAWLTGSESEMLKMHAKYDKYYEKACSDSVTEETPCTREFPFVQVSRVNRLRNGKTNLENITLQK